MMPTPLILIGDAAEKLKEIPDRSVQMVVTSPPYYGLRDYGDPRQLGSESTPGLYIDRLVVISNEIRRVLRDDGTYWLNLGDSYYNYRPGVGQSMTKQSVSRTDQSLPKVCARRGNVLEGFKEKDRMMIPARVAIALQADGWYLRDEIVWHKPNPMPESVSDRTTKSHEFIYMLTKREQYYYDGESIKERGVIPEGTMAAKGSAERFNMPGVNSRPPEYKCYNGFRNKRSVWTVNTDSSGGGDHFAVFPPLLIKPCIMAGSRYGDTVLDPFGGRGTTGEVCIELGRNCILIELNPKYAALCERSVNTTPGLPL
jgi:DNA modification methylase